MKHSVREFYRIDGQKLYTEDYIIANNIPMCKKGDYRHGWSVALYFSPNRDTVNVYTANGKVVMYAFGEKTLFDTREERDAYRIQYAEERNCDSPAVKTPFSQSGLLSRMMPITSCDSLETIIQL